VQVNLERLTNGSSQLYHKVSDPESDGGGVPAAGSSK
jgi:hypothetical protein